MWTISINSAINNGENAHYDESCSSTLASTFSNGAKDPHTGVVCNFILTLIWFNQFLYIFTRISALPLICDSENDVQST